MNAGEIGTEAGRIFEYNLPSNWMVRSQEDQNDHGIDAEIELKDEYGKALGTESVFKVQIKGEEHSTFISNNEKLSFNIRLDRLKYYFEFRIPVILVVVEVSTERVFWVPITNDEKLLEKVESAALQDTIQIHIPCENRIIRKESELSDKVLESVNECWDYLSISGLRKSIDKYPTIDSEKLNKRIDDIGDALFRAYHQKLNNLLMDKKFYELYKQASEMLASPIVPAKERFLAVMYYELAFDISPYTNIKREIVEEKFKICHILISLSREQRSKPHRFVAISKARKTIFKMQLDQLIANHSSVNHFQENSFERMMFDNGAHSLYRECCLSLQKIIELSGRLIREEQYGILSDLFMDIAGSILVFQIVHVERGQPEAIEFLRRWYKDIASLVFTYCSIVKDTFKIERLYFLMVRSEKLEKDCLSGFKDTICENIPDMLEALLSIENEVANSDDNDDFYSLSIEEQKEYFRRMSKDLGMDPDDPKDEFGQIVAIGLENYDPTEIMKNCEHLFVHYRPGGMIAQSLRMHSAGGMHLLVCLKHGYAHGTGNLLSILYGNNEEKGFPRTFKSDHCEGCEDCIPRESDWTWSLDWYNEELPKHKEYLSRYKF